MQHRNMSSSALHCANWLARSELSSHTACQRMSQASGTKAHVHATLLASSRIACIIAQCIITCAVLQAMKKERDNFSKRVPRKVPITWVGTANEVRMVGDFDNWGRGVDLSIPDLELDGVLRTFETTVNLLPVSVALLRTRMFVPAGCL